MTNILINNTRYDFLDFDSENEFEKAVIENAKCLFGKNSIYIDIYLIYSMSLTNFLNVVYGLMMNKIYLWVSMTCGFCLNVIRQSFHQVNVLHYVVPITLDSKGNPNYFTVNQTFSDIY